MSRKYIQWLYSELPDLINKGILSAQDSERLKGYYGEATGGNKQKLILGIFGILGALLIGLGIILMLAHNWDELSRPVRAVISVTPLIITQILAVWTMMKRGESVALREGISTFFMLAIGSSIALIGQTYNISGSNANFVLTWMLLSVPIVYLMNVSFIAILYLIGITCWAGFAQAEIGYAFFFWFLFALIAPHIYQSAKNNIYSNRTAILFWGVSLCLCISTGIVLEGAIPGLWMIVYSALFAVLYLAGSLLSGESDGVWRNPLHTIGSLGIFVLSLILTYEWIWKGISWRHYRAYDNYNQLAVISDYTVVILFLMSAVCIFIIYARKRKDLKLLYGAMPVVSLLSYALSRYGVGTAILMIVFNIYLFALGIGTISAGFKSYKIGVVNAGMIIMMTLIAARFFDIDIGFTLKGLAFILLGVGFLAANVILIRRKGGAR